MWLWRHIICRPDWLKEQREGRLCWSGCEYCRLFKDSEPNSVGRFFFSFLSPHFCSLVFTLHIKTQDLSQSQRLNCTQTQECLMWCLGERGAQGACPQQCWWGCHLDKCPHLLVFLPLFSWDMGAWRMQRGCYSKVDGWRWVGECFIVPSVSLLSEIQPAEVVESELNRIRAGRLRKSL